MHTPVEITELAVAKVRSLGADCTIALGGGSTTGLGKKRRRRPTILMCKALSVQQHVKWQRLAGCLMSAARTGRWDLIALATDQLEHALSYPPFAHVKLGVGNQKKPTARSAKRRAPRRRA
jgi:hypothetical protein